MRRMIEIGLIVFLGLFICPVGKGGEMMKGKAADNASASMKAAGMTAQERKFPCNEEGHAVELTGKAKNRYEAGRVLLQKIDGDQGTGVVSWLQEIAPDFSRYLVEFPFGDIYSRPGLDLRSREIATVAALTALGNARPQLAIHIEAALNVGCSPTEVVETIMQMAVYAGFPAALNGLAAAREVFEKKAVTMP